jgi:polyhydroxyalkanoate synthase subunit PhaC
MVTLSFALSDAARQMQGQALDLWGFGPSECSYRVIAAGRAWRLREYQGQKAGPPILIVPAPIKRPYIWDIVPSLSVVRLCLRRHFRVYLLEWTTPSPEDRNAGLADYAARSVARAAARVSAAAGGAKPFLMGHSLGGTFAAIFAALYPGSLRGVVLLSAPLSFAPGSSRFLDALVAITPPTLAATDIVPGSLLSQLCAAAAPETFLWSRLVDAGQSVGNPPALEMHVRVERWTLDEFPLPGRLVHEVLHWLYREDRFCAGTLRIDGNIVGPRSLRCPTLAVVNTADAIVSATAITPFTNRMPPGYAHLIEYPGEVGVGLQHLAVLVGRRAHASLWPKIIAWLHAQE